MPGFELDNLPEHSSAYPKGAMCNYTMRSDEGRSAGMAITVEYGCPAETEAAFQGKTGTRKKYDRSADVRRGEVQRTATSLLLREDRSGEGYAGPFTVQQKMFVLLDPQTIATIVVLTDVKPPKDENAEPDPDILIFSADQAVDLARNLAFAHADAKSNLKCAAPPAVVEHAVKPPEMSLEVTLDLTTVSGEKEIPYGETVSFPVKVSGTSKERNEPVATNHFAPLDVELYRDDTLLEKKTTDGEGSVTFHYSPPEDTPEECKKYRFKAVATKEGVGSAEDELEAEIQRGPCERVKVHVTRDGVEVPHEDPPLLFTATKGAPVRFRIEARVDPERMVKQFRFQLGGPLASFATMEQAAATGTAGEYEVLETKRADVILVIAPLSPQFEALLDTEGGIRLEVKASPD